jgi:hypothetical protein
LGTLGDDGSIGQYCGNGVATLGPLMWGRRRRRLVGDRRDGTQRGGALHGGTLRFSMRSRRIKWRIEAKITLVLQSESSPTS